MVVRAAISTRPLLKEKVGNVKAAGGREELAGGVGEGEGFGGVAVEDMVEGKRDGASAVAFVTSLGKASEEEGAN